MVANLIHRVILITLVGAFCFLQVTAEQMSSDGPYYDFASYMLEKTYSASIDCEEDSQDGVNIDVQWFCGLASVDEAMFKSLWDTYISVRPAGIYLNSVSTWGNIALADNLTLKGRLYKTNDGYIIVSYNTPPPESSAEGSIKIGYATKLDYSELPFYIPSGQATATPKAKPESVGAPLEDTEGTSENSEEDSDSEDNEASSDREPKIIEGESLSFNDEIVFGDKDAPITIIEYSDYNCPSCAIFHDETLPLLIKNYIDTGKVKFVYRDVTMIGRSTTESAVNASLCVRKQLNTKDHLSFINDIYSAPRPRNAKTIQGLAQDLKINKKKLNNCIQDQVYKTTFQTNNRQSRSVGAQGTPTFIIGKEKNGQFEGIKVPGRYSYDDFAFVLDELQEKLK